MRKLLLTTLLLANSFIIIAQKELPPYGKIDKEDLLLTQCEFDKDAEAYKLLTYGDVKYTINGDNWNIETDRRVRIKILKDKGLNQSNIKLKFYNKSGYENIKNISALTYNLDNSGNIITTKLEKSLIYTKKLNNQVSEITFTMPDVKVGSVIEFRYTDIKKSIANLDDWYFQDDIPTRISMYTILVPSIFRFASQELAYQPIEKKNELLHESSFYHSSRLTYDSDEKTYLMRNIPAIRSEPYMGAKKDYLQRVIFQLAEIDYGGGHVEQIRSTWPKLTKELLEDEDFGLQLKKNIPHTKSLFDSLKNAHGDYDKMVMIHDYIRRNMNWNGSESIYSTDGIKSAWDKKSGNNSELNLILINLLREAGLKAYPLLVSTKDNGTVNTIFPFLYQFNNTMTCVLIGDKKYILNAADKYNPPYLIPYDVVNNDAFIVDNEFGGWINLSDKNDIWKNVVYCFAEITPKGSMEGKATVSSFDYSKNPRVKAWEEEKSTFKDYFSKDYAGIKIKNLEVTNENKDSLPLVQKFEFSLPINSSGGYEYFSLNLFQGLEKNPFIADERNTDIDFNYKQSYMVVGKIYIPEDFQFDELPKNIRLIMPDTSIVLKRMIQADNNAIDFRVSLDFEKPFYTADSYPLFHEFYKKLFSILNEQVVIKKKLVNP